MGVCLICTNNIIDKTKSIFDIDDEHKIQIKDILFDLNFKICIKDTGSDSICYECYVELLKIYNFRDECCILFDCEENFVGCCQLCLEETDEFRFLSDCILINNESSTVLEILNKICSYDLTDKYDGEQYVCKTCFKTCLDNYPFFLKCEKATEYWNNSILNKSGQIRSGFDFSITEENSAIVKTEETDNEAYKPDSDYCGSDSDPDYNTESDTESFKSNSIQLLQKEKLYTCNVCSKTFEKLSSLANHKKVHNRNLLHCYTCMKGFKSKSQLITHMKTHINYLRKNENLTKDFLCSICGKAFHTNHDLNTHTIKACVPCEMLYKCELCPKTFKHKSGRTQHEHELHRLYRCDICPEKFKDKDALSQHKFVHKGERPFMCDKCPKTFPNALCLRQHKLCVHSTEYSYKCYACPKKFKMKNALRVHEFLHKGERPFMCEKCSKTFTCRSHLKVHSLTHLEEKSHECDICLKKFKYKRILDLHKLTHSDIRPYKCDLCSKTFKRRTHLSIHKTIHNTERIFKCTTCSKAFYSKGYLQKHKKLHSVRKLHKCQLCLREFTTTNGLRLHMERNICNNEVQEGPFICEFCSREFNQLPSLLLHQKVVHINDEKTVNNGPFKCDICKKEYKLLRILKIHMGMTHNKKN